MSCRSCGLDAFLQKLQAAAVRHMFSSWTGFQETPLVGATSAVVLGGWMLRRSRHGDSKCNGRIGFVIVCAYEDLECRMGWGRGLISWKLREGQEGRGGSTRGLQFVQIGGPFSWQRRG